MNLILFREEETQAPLPLSDPRGRHIVTVLGCGIGDRFDAGIINGARGKAEIAGIDAERLHLSFDLTIPCPPLRPLLMIVGLTRPVYARRIIRELSGIGVEGILFCAAEKGEASYRKSSLWKNGNYEPYLIEGAQRAFSTAVPRLEIFASPAAALESLDSGSNRYFFDVYTAVPAGGLPARLSGTAVAAVGPERGWSDPERQLFKEAGFAAARMGDRILGTESAALLAAALLLDRMGLLR
jgi:RsmE family RNA methyltransferase